MKVIDRRHEALGGQANNRRIEDIRNIGLHYTAVLGFITGHERHWRDTRKWDRGGYILYIDRDANLYINYDYTRVTYGASGWNRSTVHISVEARNKFDYTDAQLKTLDYAINKVLKDCPNTSPDRIFGHWEMTPTTACPGWNKAELNEIRAKIKSGQSLATVPVHKPTTPSKTLDAVAQEVIDGVWGNGADRMNALAKNGYDALEVQQRVNDILKPGDKDERKPINTIAHEVMDGKWGNGQDRTKRLTDAGYDASAVQKRVNELSAPPKPQLKPLDTIAREVIAGKWGNGQDRFNRLNTAGYSAQQVQERVNELSRPVAPKRKTVDEVAREIMNGQGGWGNNPQRRERLIEQGYSPNDVQARVNALSNANSVPKRIVIEKNNRVRVNQSAQTYVTGQRIPAYIKGKTYTVQQTRTQGSTRQVLLKEISSWVRESDVTKV